jgi:hypothetical protein
LLYRVPDTEWSRSVMVRELVSLAHVERTPEGPARDKLLGTTPLQAVITILRWSVLGGDEHNAAKVKEPPACRPGNWDQHYRLGRFDAMFAMALDLLTRLLSNNPAVYEKGMVNTKASWVADKHNACVFVCFFTCFFTCFFVFLFVFVVLLVFFVCSSSWMLRCISFTPYVIMAVMMWVGHPRLLLTVASFMSSLPPVTVC